MSRDGLRISRVRCRLAMFVFLLLGIMVPVASAGEVASAGDAQVAVVGNPIQSPAALEPAAQDRPRGSTPAKHVYVDTFGGNPSAYAVMLVRLPAGRQVERLDLTFADDAGGPGTLENVAADTAALQACAVIGTVKKEAPDAPITVDCSAIAPGLRKARPDGSGTWTFDLQALRGKVESDGSVGVAVVAAPDATGNFSVAMIRDSIQVPYALRPSDNQGASSPLAPGQVGTEAAPTTPVASETLAAGLGLAAGPSPDAPVQEPLVAGDVPSPVVVQQTNIAAVGIARAGGSHPLLLLLAPLVALAVLMVAGRLDPGRTDGEEEGNPYPELPRR